MRFHERFGFTEVGRFCPHSPDFEEAMLVKVLDTTPNSRRESR
jgi:hypothetical protein